MISNRQSNIIRYLARQEDYVTIQQLAQEFDISPRTVRNDLDQIHYILKKKNIILERKPRLGIRLQADLEPEEFMESGNCSQEERIYRILVFLILCKKTTLEELEGYLGVSKNTVVSDVKSAEELLKIHGIQLCRKAYYGMTIQGEEELIRNFLFNLYINRVNRLEMDIIRAIKEITEDYTSLNRTLIAYVEQKEQIQYSDEALYELDGMLSASLHRSALGMHVADSLLMKQMENDLLYSYVREFAEQCQNLQLPNGDLCYITMLLESAKRLSGREDGSLNAGRQSEAVCEEILHTIFEQLGIEFLPDEELEKQFLIHLKTAVFRLQNHIKISNPLLEEIQYTAAFMYEMADKVLRQYEGRLGVSFPDAEIAYAAVYLEAFYQSWMSQNTELKMIIVCNGGMATSTLLKQRLAMYLPKLPVLGTFRAAGIQEKLSELKPDIILTTIPLNLNGYRVIRVNPLLDSADIRKITETITDIRDYGKNQQLLSHIKFEKKQGICTFLKPEYCQFGSRLSDWRAAVRTAAMPLVGSKKIDEKYIDEMIKVVVNIGNYMVFIPEIAFVHARPDYVYESAIAVLNLVRPIPFGHKKQVPVKTIVVIANKEENYMLVNMMHILQKKNHVELFKAAECFEDLLRLEEQL